MSTILTIDFDIVMSPSIELYNDLIYNRVESVDELFEMYPFS